jgi:small subunit ribosomal protein S14
MAKKSILQREKNREALVKKYSDMRYFLKKSINAEKSFEKKLGLYSKIQKLPRNSSSSRLF